MKTNIDYFADDKKLELVLFIDDREVFKIECVNIVHFYVVCFAAQRFKDGMPVDLDLFKPVKRS